MTLGYHIVRVVVQHSKIAPLRAAWGQIPTIDIRTLCLLPPAADIRLKSAKAAVCRYCCKSPKLGGDNFPTIRRSNRRAPIFVASAALARSLTSLSSGHEVPHIFTRKSRL